MMVMMCLAGKQPVLAGGEGLVPVGRGLLMVVVVVVVVVVGVGLLPPPAETTETKREEARNETMLKGFILLITSRWGLNEVLGIKV
jgi:hypothetical protein